MTENRRAMQEVLVPDLLAALTAHGLGGFRPLPHGNEEPRRSCLAQCAERILAHDDASTAPGSPDLDDEWMGGSYAQSRRLLDAALRAIRQRKGVV